MIRDACWWWQQSDSSFLGLRLGLFFGFFLASALVAGVGTHGSEGAEHLAISVSVSNLGKFDSVNGFSNW
jgi:hypothetical protein